MGTLFSRRWGNKGIMCPHQLSGKATWQKDRDLLGIQLGDMVPVREEEGGDLEGGTGDRKEGSTAKTCSKGLCP